MSYKKWFVAIGTVVLCLVAACGYAQGPTNVTGWEGKTVFYIGDGSEGTVEGIDINGEVGYPLSVFQPQAHCESGGWNAQMEIVSGTLPPGLSFDNNNWRISGIPTERGHWIMRIKVKDIECNGVYCMGYTQELRFHITGTGKVIE